VQEDDAVALALAEFNQQADAGLDVEMGEALPRLAAQTAGISPANEFALIHLGLTPDQASTFDSRCANYGGAEYDAYLRAEQACLLEALVRCWARRGLPRLLAEYEVLEVEREGKWELADGLWFLSRPDALLRHRQSGDLVLQSFKTTGAMDARKLRDAERDMQGLSEGVQLEQRLARQWQYAQETRAPGRQPLNAVGEWLYSLSAPPRITAIRYEYILKGERDKRSRVAKALSARVGFEARIQQSPLTYLWVKPGMTAADTEIAHSFGWTDESGKERKLAWQSWNQAPVWEHTTVGAWIDLLDAGTVQPETGRDVLAEQLVPPVLVYRQDDDLRDMIEQVEAQEVEVQRDLMAVNAAVGEDGKRSALNQRFPQTRTACSYPGECAYVPICYGGADIRRDPMGSGKYKARVPNHPQELTQMEVT
jgi:hypothetical protein